MLTCHLVDGVLGVVEVEVEIFACSAVDGVALDEGNEVPSGNTSA